MNRALIAFAGLALTTGVATAEFIGVTVREDKGLDPIADDPNNVIPDDTRVFNLYAVFDGTQADDFRNTVLSVGDTFLQIGKINNPNAQFVQVADGFRSNEDLAPNAQVAGFFPETLFDTYVGIGTKVGAGAATTDPDFNDAAGGVQGNTIIGGWFNSDPPNLQGAATTLGPSGGFEVFLGNFGITGLEAGAVAGEGFNGGAVDTNWLSNIFLGELTVNRQGDTSLGEPTAVGFTVSFNKIPTPGALALFGVAGLAAARRRR